VEAPARSGALITADFALQQGRDLYVHQEGLSGVSGEGTRKLAEDGAPVVNGFSCVAGDWGYITPAASCHSEETAKDEEPGKALASFLEKELMNSENNYSRRTHDG